MRALALGMTVLFLLTSCNSLNEGSSESELLTETEWKLVSIESETVVTKTAGKGPYRLFFDSENDFSGVSDCNDIFGQYSAFGEDGQIKISELGSSLVRCSPESLNEEFIRLLGSASTFEVEEGQLTITSDKGTLVFDRVSRNEYTE